MKDPYPRHGRRRRWRVLWTVGCRCGMDAYPCLVEQMLKDQKPPRHAAASYSAPLRYGQGWRDSDRRWSGGAR